MIDGPTTWRTIADQLSSKSDKATSTMIVMKLACTSRTMLPILPDRYFFALAVIHAMRCASSIVALIAATQAGNGLAILALSATLTASHGALIVGCHLQRRWAKVGSIVLDVQASFMTIIVLIALSDFELSWSAMVSQVVGPSITIWLAIKARVDRRRRLVTTATGIAA